MTRETAMIYIKISFPWIPQTILLGGGGDLDLDLGMCLASPLLCYGGGVIGDLREQKLKGKRKKSISVRREENGGMIKIHNISEPCHSSINS